jgi:arabinofuranosyltransferase
VTARPDGGWPRGRRDDVLLGLAAAIPLALFLARERAIAGVPGLPLDDAWIHLHFARNLAEGAGFAYNPGVPVAGSTAPLWTLVLGAGAFVAGPTLVMAKIVGVVCLLTAAWLTRRAALAWGATPPMALAAGVALAWTGGLAWGALSGMEVTLAAALVAGALLAHARDSTTGTALLAGLAVLARPEAAILAPALALARPIGARRLAVFGLVVAAVVSPAVAFNLATLGTPLPATAVAKIEGGLLGWLGGMPEPAARTWLWRPARFVGEWVGWLVTTHPALAALVPVALGVAAARQGRALAVAGAALLAHPVAMALLAPYRGPGFQEGRYSIHLLPLAMVLLAVAAGTLGARPRRLAAVAYLAVALLTLPAAAERYAWAVQNINAMQVHLGRWVEARLPAEARLALNDIGAIAFFSRRPVIDLMGLVTPEIVPFRREGEAGVIRYVAATCPDYVIIFPDWFPRLAARDDLLEPLHRVRLDRPEVSGGPEMVVYRLRRCAV